MKMALLKVTDMLLVLLTALLSVEAANIPVPQGKSVEDIFSTLNTFKTNIIGLISNRFSAPKKINPPSPQEIYHHGLPPQSPPSHQSPPSQYPDVPQIPHDLSQAFYVTSPPNLGHNPHPQFDTHGPNPMPQPFPIMDINIPSQLQFVEKPSSAPEIIPFDTDFQITTDESTNPGDTSNGIDIEESLHAGPQSFVDSARVNAGIEVAIEVDDEVIKNIPEDLWREDINGIKKNCKKDNKSDSLK